MHRHQLNRLAIMGEIDPGAIAQAAITPNIERREIGLTHDGEPALDREAGVLLAVQGPFGRSSTYTS
jgi:hypothetical protein